LNNNETITDFEERNILNIEKVIEVYNHYIYSIIEHAISNQEDIEEILSDVFLSLWKNYSKLDKDTNVRAYLIGITKNLIKKKYRNYHNKIEIKNIEDTLNKKPILILDDLFSELDNEKINNILKDIKYTTSEDDEDND